MNVSLTLRFLALVSLAPCASAAEQTLLWEIGQRDNDTQDLALGRDKYAEFSEDPLFVVGQSDAALEWPYCHPGPQDAWAGSRPHTFTIVFGLAAVPVAACPLTLDFADAHAGGPPAFRIDVNGHESGIRLSPGTGDAVIFGDVSAAQEKVRQIAVPPSTCAPG